ncbi:uncharacterized protein KY384_007479 [Bacidia gigantensis]|uniref:uncharacterized protein n=1 Tax=Bacidia gigantensis TaxID=2732470 RepID=UPI001D03D843|nr:uncharacterized protein KY384_007479 [Bacidia gigantensis]KAG8527327.1 hypothetical protein KY384_007479 [Bacidia gigantensis]
MDTIFDYLTNLFERFVATPTPTTPAPSTSTSPKPAPKPPKVERDLNQQTLGKNGIEYGEDKLCQRSFGAHVASLKDELLSRGNPVSELSYPEEDQARPCKPPSKTELDPFNSGFKYRRVRRDSSASMCEDAENMRKKDEGAWMDLLKRSVFADWVSSKEPRVSRNISGGTQLMWNEADKCRILPFAPYPTHPKPDFYFSIQIYEKLREPMGFFNKAFQELSFESLKACKGLRYCPSIAPRNAMHEGSQHNVCFPFAIAEVKADGVSDAKVTECFCQAANAASCALAMLCDLSRHNPNAEYWHRLHHDILPVICFTFIGYRAKVWLAYVSDYGCAKQDEKLMHQYYMQCIWDGDIRKNEDAVEIYQIVDRAAQWFVYVYRPWVLTCLGHWRSYRSRDDLKKAWRLDGSQERAIESAYQHQINAWPVLTKSSERSTSRPATPRLARFQHALDTGRANNSKKLEQNIDDGRETEAYPENELDNDMSGNYSPRNKTGARRSTECLGTLFSEHDTQVSSGTRGARRRSSAHSPTPSPGVPPSGSQESLSIRGSSANQETPITPAKPGEHLLSPTSAWGGNMPLTPPASQSPLAKARPRGRPRKESRSPSPLCEEAQ